MELNSIPGQMAPPHTENKALRHRSFAIAHGASFSRQDGDKSRLNKFKMTESHQILDTMN